jgi:surface protein
MVESGAVAQAIGNLASSVIAATALGEESMMANLPIADSTLRFSFGDLDYNPTVAGVGSSGTWTKKNTKFTNVWDWTNTNTSWATAFGGGTGIPGAFADYENNPVKVIAAGDTSSVTDFSRCFSWCTAITEICSIDTSNATTVFLMFNQLHNCTKFPDMDFSSAVSSNGVAGVYQSCYKMKTAPNIVFPSSTQYSLANFFSGCVGLENVPLYDTSMCNNMSGMFDMNVSGVTQIPCLKSVPLFDTSRVTDMSRMFRGCANLEDVPEFDTSNVTNMSTMFYGILNTTSKIPMHIKSVPDFDYSKVTNFVLFLANNVDLTEIPEMNIEANVTRCDNMFINCPNIKSGQKALYDKLSAIATITNHTDCFKDCGSDTEEGRAELSQIPVSWGGTMETA